MRCNVPGNLGAKSGESLGESQSRGGHRGAQADHGHGAERQRLRRQKWARQYRAQGGVAVKLGDPTWVEKPRGGD